MLQASPDLQHLESHDGLWQSKALPLNIARRGGYVLGVTGVLHRKRLLVGLLLTLVLISFPALAEKRVALVIGNGTYKAQNLLTNPPNDAHLISRALAQAHFETIETKTNLGIAEFRQALRRFQSQANGADVAFVYFAGHGIARADEVVE